MAEFKNPSQQGGGGQDNSSLLIMMVVMVGIFFGLQYFRAKSKPATEPPHTSTSAPAQAGQTAASGAAPATASAAVTVATTPSIEATAASTTVVENELYKVTFSNRGGEVTSWILKRFKDADGKPLDLVHREAAERFEIGRASRRERV